MPLLAAFIGAIASALVTLFAKVLSFKLALKFAAYGTWITVLGVFLSTVFICMTSLYGMVSSFSISFSGSWGRLFFIGMGMVIPSNAGAVMACVASVWIASSIYKIQKQGIHNFGA
jgi:hypothetical protein